MPLLRRTFLEVLQRGIVVQIDGSQDWFEEFCINIINAVFDFNFKCSLFSSFCQFFSGERFRLILQNRRQFGQLCTDCLNEFFRSLRGGCRNAEEGKSLFPVRYSCGMRQSVLPLPYRIYLLQPSADGQQGLRKAFQFLLNGFVVRNRISTFRTGNIHNVQNQPAAFYVAEICVT